MPLRPAVPRCLPEKNAHQRGFPSEMHAMYPWFSRVGSSYQGRNPVKPIPRPFFDRRRQVSHARCPRDSLAEAQR